ncbi:MAG: M23 family metallopeptidase [Microbacterium sp.]
MRSASTPLQRVVATIALCAALAAGTLGDGAPVAAAADDLATIETRQQWHWPVSSPFRLDRGYVAPAHEYGAGHRGIDILPLGDSRALAPADGVVAFSGRVADRALVTIDHGEGLVTTLEPVESDLAPGTAVARGDVVGTVALGGHAAAGRMHFGVRLYGEYVNPLLLLGGVPRAVLLPCC